MFSLRVSLYGQGTGNSNQSENYVLFCSYDFRYDEDPIARTFTRNETIYTSLWPKPKIVPTQLKFVLHREQYRVVPVSSSAIPSHTVVLRLRLRTSILNYILTFRQFADRTSALDGTYYVHTLYVAP